MRCAQEPSHPRVRETRWPRARDSACTRGAP
jgi:hypothetical protein